MPIQVSTVYSKERLLRFNSYVVGSKKAMWVLMAVCTVVVCGGYALLAVLDAVSDMVRFCLVLILAMDAVFIVCSLLLPRLTIRKAKNLDLVIHYTFEMGSFHLEAANAYANESSTLQYAMLTKAAKRGDELYLFLSRIQAYIVDLSQLSPEQTRELKRILETSMEPRKLRWTD